MLDYSIFFKLCQQSWKVLIKYSLISGLLFLLLSLVITFFGSRLPVFVPFIFDTVRVLATTFIGLALYQSISKLMQNETLDPISHQLKQNLNLYGKYLYLNIIVTIIIFAGLILLIIPGVIFAIWYFASSYIMASEKLSPTAAMERSRSFVSGKFIIVFFNIIYISLPIIALILLTQWLMMIPLLPQYPGLFASLLSFLVTVVATPYLSLMTAFIYQQLNHKTRGGESEDRGTGYA